MDLVQILLLVVVCISVLAFLFTSSLDSGEEGRKSSDDVGPKSSLLCDSESDVFSGSCSVEHVEESDDQEEEKEDGGGNGGEKLAAYGVSERAHFQEIKEREEAGVYGVPSSEKSNLCSGVLGIDGKHSGDLEIDCDDDKVAGGDFDDWEGIERTELEKVFGEALVFVSSKSNADHISGDVKLQLYGLQRIALEGVCHESQPMALNVSARAKWNAWQKLGNMAREMAMEKYINILSEHIPEWKGDDTVYKYSQDSKNF